MQKNQIVNIGRTTLNAAPWCAAAGLVMQNLLLSHQNRGLEARISSPPAQVEVGQRLVSLSGANARRVLTPVMLPSSPDDRLLIFTLSPGCPACRQNLPGWLALKLEAQNRGWRIAWVSRDPVDYTVGYFVSQGLDATDVFADPPNRTYSQLSLSGVPSTLVVGAGGVVERVWTGLLTRKDWSDVFTYLNVAEPVLLSDKPDKSLK